MVSFVERGVDFQNVYDHFLGIYLDSEYILGTDLVRIWL